ncbi:helix-turn-helix transcriptional regulator [Schaalia hyovaginalis]|uniref:helix-turn-helix transcriptional regulator n=1 Tax=Schaalia hyovaginalis TaxID=29316 RepID=UPI0038B3045E
MRKSYRLTQIQLGHLVGLSDKTVRDIERGTGTPSLKADQPLERLAPSRVRSAHGSTGCPGILRPSRCW